MLIFTNNFNFFRSQYKLCVCVFIVQLFARYCIFRFYKALIFSDGEHAIDREMFIWFPAAKHSLFLQGSLG